MYFLNTIYLFCFLICIIEIEPSLGILRSDVIKRAKFWESKKIPYSQSQYSRDPQGKNYRTDCSGYVSMTWGLSKSLVTSTFHTVSRRISKDQLKTGDALLRARTTSAGPEHIVLFEKWTDSSKTAYIGYEQIRPNTLHRKRQYPREGYADYLPYRYANIAN